MSRKDAVLLVSRALAIIQLVSAFIDITYLPTYIMDILRHSGHDSVLMTSHSDALWLSYYRVGIALLVLRIAALLLLAVVFWNCGPWIERILLPKRETPDQSA
jgi:hypothetical protein